MSATERHYSVQQVAKMWGWSDNTIRKLFKEEKGVIKIGGPETRYKAKHWQLSIPESVLLRVYTKLSN